MSNTLNKQVTAKFQNVRKSVNIKPVQSKTASTKAATLRPIRTTLAVGLPKPTESVQPIKPKVLQNNLQSVTSPASPLSSTTSFVQKSKAMTNLTSKPRAGAATLPRNSQIFNTISKRIYRPVRSTIFDYDLSKEEKRYFEHNTNAMKSVPANELELIRSGQRSTYLETRYEHTPDTKYNYPEATSWRYGWFHK